MRHLMMPQFQSVSLVPSSWVLLIYTRIYDTRTAPLFCPGGRQSDPLTRAGNPHPDKRLAMSSEDVWYMQHVPAEHPLALRSGKCRRALNSLRKIFLSSLSRLKFGRGRAGIVARVRTLRASLAVRICWQVWTPLPQSGASRPKCMFRDGDRAPGPFTAIPSPRRYHLSL